MAQFSLTTVSNLFKIKYGKLSDNVFNSANVFLGRTKKNYDFTGKQKFIPVPMSFAGGVGSGSLPTPNYHSVEDALLTAKKMYSVISIDRESIKASADDEGAFVRLTKQSVSKGVESFMRNLSRSVFNTLDNGALGYFSGSAAGTATDPVITVTAASWLEANWEEKDFVNVNSLSSVWEVISVDPATKAVTLSRISGSDDLTAIGAGTHKVYMQNSKNNDPTSLGSVISATSGSLYGISVGRRWGATQKDAGGSGLVPDLMNEVMLEVQRKSGKVPNLIMTSFTQYRKLLNSLEDLKRYQLDPRSAELKGKISFAGVEFMSSAGPVGVFPERFMKEDEMWFLNDSYCSLECRPDFGWFDDDGSVFLRDATDSYSARYGGYLEGYYVPTFFGRIHSLAV